jgi:hypothetical protein
LEELDGIHQLIDWREIERRLSGLHDKKHGEQAWQPLLMFKALLLQSGRLDAVGSPKDCRCYVWAVN